MHFFFLEPENLLFAKPGFSESHKSGEENKQFFRAWQIDFSQLPMLNPSLGSQGKEREWEGKIPWRQGSCSIMVRVLDFRLEGWRFKSRQRTLSASNRVCHYVIFLVSCSLPFHYHTARATCQSCCKAWLHGLEAVQACAKKNRSLKNRFSA